MSVRTHSDLRRLRVGELGWVSMQCTDCEVKWRGDIEDPCWACGTTGTPAPNASLFVD